MLIYWYRFRILLGHFMGGLFLGVEMGFVLVEALGR